MKNSAFGAEGRDWTYWLLYPYMAVALIPWIGYRVRMRYVFPLLAVWLLFALARRRVIRLPAGGVARLIWAILFYWLYQAMDLLFLLFGHAKTGLNLTGYLDGLHVLGGMLILHLSICNGCFRELRRLTIFCLLCMGVGAAISLIGVEAIEGGSRALTGMSGAGVDIRTIRGAVEMGIGGYGHVYSWGLLVFPMCFFLRFFSSWSIKLGIAGLAILLVAAVHSAEYTICMMGIILGGILYLLTVLGVRRPLLQVAGVAAVVLIVTLVANPRSAPFLGEPLRWLADRTTSDEYRERMVSIAETVEGAGESYALFRSELYWQSWRVFLRHPLFGTGILHYQPVGPVTGEEGGGHSLVFDLLARGGIFGLLTLALFFVCHYGYLRVLSATALGYRWWPAYYIFIYPACAIAFLNPLMGSAVINVLLLYIPALAVLSMKSRLLQNSPMAGVARASCPCFMGGTPMKHGGLQEPHPAAVAVRKRAAG